MYVDNQKLSKELDIWAERVRGQIERGEKPERMTEYIGECVYLICNNMSFMPQFINYSYKDEMIGDAIENCIKYSKNYNKGEIKYKNAFGYISKIVYQAFVRRITLSNKKYADHLNYIRNGTNIQDMKDALDADNPNDIAGYKSYVDYIVEIIDTMNIELPPPKKKKKKLKPLTALEEAMGETQDEE